MAALLRRGLSEEGVIADLAASGQEAVWMALSTDYNPMRPQ
jgi:DNA-binding response OmpR family regulator